MSTKKSQSYKTTCHCKVIIFDINFFFGYFKSILNVQITIHETHRQIIFDKFCRWRTNLFYRIGSKTNASTLKCVRTWTQLKSQIYIKSKMRTKRTWESIPSKTSLKPVSRLRYCRMSLSKLRVMKCAKLWWRSYSTKKLNKIIKSVSHMLTKCKKKKCVFWKNIFRYRIRIK